MVPVSKDDDSRKSTAERRNEAKGENEDRKELRSWVISKSHAEDFKLPDYSITK
jgi:hypothetical protein